MSKRDRLEQMPLYQKALQILKITMGLVEIVPKDNEYLQETTVRFMMENAILLAPKIAGASAIDLYDLKMENATLVRKAARDLYVQAGSLRYEETIPDQDYIRLLRSEIEEFRLLFVDWVENFDQWNYIKDDWGLFNPPGVSAHDKDPDEDIPFDPDAFFENMGDGEDDDEEWKWCWFRNSVKDSNGKPVKEAVLIIKQTPKERPAEAPFGVMFYERVPADL